jgi:enoyl-CoA hydratase/carnithine racemase
MIEPIDHGAVRELRLARPPANALDPGLIGALWQALHDAIGDGREAVVISGSPGRFSGGLDVPALLTLDRAGITEMWRSFFRLLRDLATSPVPVVAAMTGHCPAGGTVLALFADHRVFAQGAFVVGLNEVRVGIPVPEVIVRALAFVVGDRRAADLVTRGLLLGPDEALRVGLVDELAPPAEVVPRALAHARELLALPRAAMLGTRLQARRPLVAVFDAVDESFFATVTDQWFSDEAQATLRALASRLGKSA